MKKIVVLTLCLCGLLLAGFAPMTDEQGLPVLVPAVQKMTVQNGVFILPGTLSISAPKNFCTKKLEQAYLEKIPQAKFQTSSKAACVLVLTGKAVPQNPEGYTLKITRSGIQVASRTQQGLFYGMQTLIQYIHNSQGNQLKCCIIEDWPDLKMRGFFFELPYVHPSKTNRLCQVIETLAHLKYNTILIEFADNFPYQNVKFAKRKYSFSKENVQQIMETARRNHVELIPMLQVGSHAQWITRHASSPKILECGRERGWGTAYCLCNKEAEQIVDTVIQEQIDMLKPKQFHMGLDEFTHNPDFHKCPACSKIDVVQLFANHAKKFQKKLLDQGITPIVFDDEFTSAYPYRGKRPYTAILDQFDKRVSVNCWDYCANPSGEPYKDFVRRGFKKVTYMSWFAESIYNVMTLPRLAYQMGSDGCILSTWYYVDAGLNRPAGNNTDQALPGIVYQANYNWKPMDKPLDQLPYDCHQIMRRLLDPKGIVSHQGTATPLPLGSQLNYYLGKEDFFPNLHETELKKAVAAAAGDAGKFKLIIKGNLYAAAVLGAQTAPFPAKSVTFPINDKFTSLSILNCLSPTNTYYDFRKRGKKPTVGTIRFQYTDGSFKEIPLRFRYDLQGWNEVHGAYNARVAWGGQTSDHALCKFFALDLRNPKPAVPVKELKISIDPKADHTLALFAISLYGTTAKYPNAANLNKEPPIALPAKITGAELFGPKQQNISTFAFIQTKGFYAGTIQKSVVKDKKGTPEILIKIPAMLPMKERKIPYGAYGRVYLNIPYPKGATYTFLCFQVYCDDPEEVVLCNFYVMGKKETANALIRATDGLSKGWNTIKVPFSAFAIKENGGVPAGQEDHIRLAFRIQNTRNAEIRLKNIFLTNAKIPGQRLLKPESVK